MSPQVDLRRFVHAVGRWGFRQLYHTWAWLYDAVAAAVSLGRWYDWVRAVQPFMLGPRVLEIGPGTGHLLELLSGSADLHPLGLDESLQMLQVAHRRTSGRVPVLRAVVQHMPIETSSCDTIVSTFPTDFIRDASAILEIRRVLRPGGRLVTLPLAQIVGTSPVERLMAWAMAILGEAPTDSRRAVATVIQPGLEHGGFSTALHEITIRASAVFVLVATKPSQAG